jgi:hypothetical protein
MPPPLAAPKNFFLLAWTALQLRGFFPPAKGLSDSLSASDTISDIPLRLMDLKALIYERRKDILISQVCNVQNL